MGADAGKGAVSQVWSFRGLHPPAPERSGRPGHPPLAPSLLLTNPSPSLPSWLLPPAPPCSPPPPWWKRPIHYPPGLEWLDPTKLPKRKPNHPPKDPHRDPRWMRVNFWNCFDEQRKMGWSGRDACKNCNDLEGTHIPCDSFSGGPIPSLPPPTSPPPIPPPCERMLQTWGNRTLGPFDPRGSTWIANCMACCEELAPALHDVQVKCQNGCWEKDAFSTRSGIWVTDASLALEAIIEWMQ